MNSFNYILFGATGDLAATKIFPAIIDLFEKNLLPSQFLVIALGRKEYSDKSFRTYLLKKIGKTQKSSCKKFCQNIYYLSGDIADEKLYKKIFQKLKKVNQNCNTNIYHLAILPSLYQETVKKLGQSILNKKDNSKSKILIEKPFGRSKNSAKNLDKILFKYFQENQIFRLDHYLGKDTVNNILTFRFANGLFEPIWNHHFIDHIQIQLLEKDDVKNRIQFYDNTGAIRDVLQNHLLQLLSLVLMDRPQDLSQAKVRAKRQEIIFEINPPQKKDIVIGQYKKYKKQINTKSQTETYVAAKITVNKNRWKNMPIYIRTGKALKRKVTEIAIVFKKPQKKLFKNNNQNNQNILHLRISPNEGIVFDFFAKKPGLDLKIEKQSLQFCYKNSNLLTNPYSKLILDAFRADQTSFNLKQEVMASWRFIDKIYEVIKRDNIKTKVYFKNSWGPQQSKKLIESDNRRWFNPSENFCKI